MQTSITTAEDAERILKEETPKRLASLRRELQKLKDYLRKQAETEGRDFTGGQDQQPA